MKTKLYLVFSLVLFISTVYAGNVQNVKVYSSSMQKDVETVIIVPEDTSKPLPVIYLLHGHGGSAKTWSNIKKDLPEIADKYGILFVCPDGKNSWYWDSPLNPSSQYETFISKELVSYMDENYSTIRDRRGRAITGLSMGGHGALWNAFRHTDVFGAAGSTSGGVDIRPFPKNWNMSQQLGAKEQYPDVWEKHTVINLVESLENGKQALIIDCGYADFIFDVNNAFHEKLLKYKIDHDYLVRPGGHDNNYWNNSIEYQILFFHNYFTR